jgi:hypothetical protein
VSNALAHYWRRYRALPFLQRELVTFGLLLLLGLTVLPVAIYLAGQAFLGDYIRDPSGAPTGGFFALWIDYLGGLFSASFGHWLAALGPWLLFTAGRSMVALARRDRAHPAPPPTPTASSSVKHDINQPLA